jgi:Fic family protein
MQRFNERIEKLSPRIVSRLSQIDILNGQWIGGANLSPQALSRLKRSVLVTSTGSSTRIEGAKLSDAEVEKLMRGLSTQKLADRDAQEVRGYYELLQTIFDSSKMIHFSENTIKQLHAELLKYTNKDERHRGEYKKFENRVEMKDASGKVMSILFETTPAYLTPKEMTELVSWTNDSLANRTYHPLLVIASFIVEFLKIHPFLDGNGRLSRALTNLLMLQAGYEYMPYVSHDKLIEDNKTEYYISLRQAQTTLETKDETILPWTTFFLPVLQTQAEQSIKLLSAESLDNLLSPNQLAVWEYIKSMDSDTSVQEITNATKVARPTVRQSIERLLDLKKVQRIGLGRATRYRKL